jgi:8-oxo-dGTP pyrophosphatase MutT (NUDIX family)
VQRQAGAMREAVEETGIAANDLSAVDYRIFNVDSHNIPENKKKGEPAHVHHDISFLFIYNGPPSINIDLEESTAAKWLTLKELAFDPAFAKIAEKLRSATL